MRCRNVPQTTILTIKDLIMNTDELRELFPIPNICTPYVLGYFQKGKYAIELSTGGYDGVLDCYTFGVTVVTIEPWKHCIDLCKSFTGTSEMKAKEKAMEYIESFR